MNVKGLAVGRQKGNTSIISTSSSGLEYWGGLKNRNCDQHNKRVKKHLCNYLWLDIGFYISPLKDQYSYWLLTVNICYRKLDL